MIQIPLWDTEVVGGSPSPVCSSRSYWKMMVVPWGEEGSGRARGDELKETELILERLR